MPEALSAILATESQTFYRCLPIALARYRMLLMFFTSVLTPSGSPGLCTETLASTLSCPSEQKEVNRCTRRKLSLGLEVWQLGSTREGERQTVISIPDMLPWQVPRACRMSCSSLTAAAASSPQLMSGSITSSIRPTPEDSNVSHLKGLKLSDKPLLCWLT